MKKPTKLVFILLIASLPASYFTAVPAVVCSVLFLALYADERFFSPKQIIVSDAMEKEIAELQRQVSMLNLRAGFGDKLK